MAADIATTLNAWSSTSSSNQPDTSDPVGPNTLAQNLQVIQSVMRAASAGDGTIASATTTDLSTVNDGDITVSGTTTITGFGTLTAGIKKILTFSGALTLTHNATSLILPGAANITTAAGDVAIMRSLGSGNWKCISFTRAASLPTTSADIQVQLATAFTTGGTGTAYTGTPNPAITTYGGTNTQEFDVLFNVASGASPTLTLNGLASPPTLVKQNADGSYTNIAANEIPAGWQSKVKLINSSQALVRSLPAGSSKQLQSVTASVGSNELTVGLNPTSLDFRNATLTNGVPNTRSVPSAISLTVPSGATLGTVSGRLARLALLAIDNAGTVEMAITNLAGGLNLDETTLVSTTAISASSNSANVIYSTTAITNVPFRVVGFTDISEVTAGLWVNIGTTLQGIGGQALAALSSLGYGQTWQSVTRTSGTTYYNTTGKPIMLSMYAQYTSGVQGSTTVSCNGGTTVTVLYNFNSTVNAQDAGTIIIPAGASYVVTDTHAITRTSFELR